MQGSSHHGKTKLSTQIVVYFFMAIGAFLAAFAIEVFLIPNRLIDGGTVGLAMICGNQTDTSFIPLYLIIINLPFVILAYKTIGRTFVMHMIYAVIVFALSMICIRYFMPWAIFHGESLEVVVIGGAILGIGGGLVIRYGGSMDGTEILGIIINQRTGITVGQVVLFCNIFIFGLAGVIFQDWHPPLLSLINYMVATKIMDSVIVGLDEVKSVMIISSKSQEIAESIMHELGLGLTIMYGRGGYSGDEREILYVISERLQLADLKELIHQIDPNAFVAIENLHEVAYGKQTQSGVKKTKLLDLFMRIVGKSPA